MAEKAYIVEAVRTAGGKRDGKLSLWHPADLGAKVLDELVTRLDMDPALVDDVAAVPAPRRKSILSILKKQDKSLTRRHSFGNFGRAQSPTAATQFAKQQVQSFPSPQFQLRVPTATSPVSKTSTTVSNDSSNYAIPRRSSLRAKNRRKSGTAGLRALMGVKTKLKAAKKNEK